MAQIDLLNDACFVVSVFSTNNKKYFIIENRK